MSEDLEKLKLVTDKITAESNLHWSRNNYFLTCSSVLLLAISMSDVTNLQFCIASLGFVLNIVWLFFQYRSSKYISYWKKLSKSYIPPDMKDIYSPEVGGIEMRKVAFTLPIAFAIIWGVIIIFLSI